MLNEEKTQIQIANDLKALGLREGGVLLVHTSLRSLGKVRVGAKTVVRGLLRALGENVTLLMPALSYAHVDANNPVFDVLNTRSCVGALPEYSVLEDLGIILTRRNLKDIAALYCERYSFLNRPPGLFIMVLSNRCNNRCLYCHAQSEKATDYTWDMKEEVAYKAVDFFFSAPAINERLHIEFQGGEPLLRYKFMQKVMDYALAQGEKKGRNLTFAMTSNLTLMTDEIAEDLKRRNIHPCASLDGPADVHDAQRRSINGKGTYDKVVYWIKRLQEKHGMQQINALPTFTVNSLGYEEKMVDEYIELGLGGLVFRPMHQLNPLDKSWPLRVSAEGSFQSWVRLFEYIIKKNRDGIDFCEGTARFLLQNMLTVSQNFGCLRLPCGAAGISEITVDHKGDLFICDVARSVDSFILGNVMTHTYDEIVTSEMARSIRALSAELLPLYKSSPFTAYGGLCIVRSFRQHGSPVPEGPNDFEYKLYNKMIAYLFEKLMDENYALILNKGVQ